MSRWHACLLSSAAHMYVRRELAEVKPTQRCPVIHVPRLVLCQIRVGPSVDLKVYCEGGW